jgi:hypothetical protein
MVTNVNKDKIKHMQTLTLNEKVIFMCEVHAFGNMHIIFTHISLHCFSFFCWEVLLRSRHRYHRQWLQFAQSVAVGTLLLGIPPHLVRRKSGTQRDTNVNLGPGRCFALSSIFHSVSVPNMDLHEANPQTEVEKIQGVAYLLGDGSPREQSLRA